MASSSLPNPITSIQCCCGASSSSKHQKLANEETVDWISNLPDPILVRILSFLPTKDAVKTAVLSKRKWQSLWTKLVDFDFIDGAVEAPPTQSFTHFVYRVLLQNNSPSIHKFRLQCSRNGIAADLESWLLMAIAKNVEEIYLDIPEINLPRRVLTSKTLTFLELSGENAIKIPGSSHICFPCLKTLHLHHIRKMDDGTFRKLISRCPVLENLSVHRGGDEMDEVRSSTVSSPTLKSLKVEHLDDGSTRISVSEVEIDVPALEYLFLKDHTSELFFLTNIRSLVEAHVSIGFFSAGLRRWKDTFRYPEVAVESFAAFRNVKFLSFSGRISSTCGLEEQLSSTRIMNLTHLVLGGGCFVWLQLLPYLLETADNLEFLKFPKDFQNETTIVKGSWIDPENAPNCLTRSLREIHVGDFLGSGDEFAMLQYLLKKGRVLEILDIHPTLSTRTKADFDQKISKFPILSDTCEITFS